MEIKRYDVSATMRRVTEAGDFLFFSGHVAASGATMEEQAQVLFRRLDKLFDRFGTDKDHMVMATIYMPDIQQKEAFNRIWDQWISEGCAPPGSASRPDWAIRPT